jgi:predicted dehydrogenase
MVEQATHSVDKLSWAMNDELPTRCTAVGGRQVRPNTPEFGNIYDHFAVTYEFASGARGFHTCRHWPACPTDNSDYIMGARGTCTVNGWTDTHVITGENAWTCSSPRNDMYQEEHNQLFASIRAGKPINDGVWMSHSTLMSIMGRMAAYTGAVVSWEEAMNSQERLGPPDYGPEPYVWPPVAVPGQTKFY